MPQTAISFGRYLIVLGIIGYGAAFYGGNPSPTALIPAAFGVILLILGYTARAKENLRKHLMHAAVLVGVIGFVVPLINLIRKIGSLTLSLGTVAQIAMVIVCGAFVLISVKSFLDARKGG